MSTNAVDPLKVSWCIGHGLCLDVRWMIDASRYRALRLFATRMKGEEKMKRKENIREQQFDAAMEHLSEHPGYAIAALSIIAAAGFLIVAFFLPPIVYALKLLWAPINGGVQWWWDFWLK